MTFESTTISRISWTRPRSVEMPPNVLRFSCRRRRAARDDFKNRTISRAEGGQLQAPVGPAARKRSAIIAI